MKKLITYLLFMVLSCSVINAQNIQNNGKVREELSYDKQQRLHGKCLAWNADSVLIGEVNYKHGVKHGVWRIYYDNGNQAYEMHYDNGKKVGVWKQWDVKGNLVNEKRYS